ncbi:MAG: LytR/AlgR family response regulator transcription factor [Bacteroidales bacterium]
MNKSIKVVLIEDEIPAARRLRSMIEKIRPEWEVITLPGSIEDANEWFASNAHPDLIFLDIELSDGDSFLFLQQSAPDSMIIFTTAYNEYAIQAFTVNSIDYLLKPIKEERLIASILKFETFTSKYKQSVKSQSNRDVMIDALVNKDKKYRTRFLISGADKFWTLQVGEIAYFYTEKKVTFAVTKNAEEYIIDFSLDKLIEQLDPDRFFRANRQTIISIESIRKIEPYFNSKVVVLLQPPAKNSVFISKEKVPAFKIWLNF